ncbi:Trehalose synthase [Rhodovastum atsumiense]|uniref:Maltokinase n=1 Tax=Rhodovastum atsumiense TaxID=504468 RepID=A0A5M6IQP2_9PROT|nr:maltose alpha-D-glucosyltransferase [Rhodovastum atsumiense]KAA5610541.1 maltose alpha-D-glucosyltransferase [Rhodovastum atsumiense]CAH2605008.1 Trehalose synthase [Rhodovastum atsumiense]
MSHHTAPPPPEDPLWYKDAVIYQLHLKSFFDSDNDGVGDFKGLMSKLDYIAELGVTAIWLLPFYPSPRRDDGYDIADYRGVHPEYGNLGDVRRFIHAAHARGLKVITELVINHTSDQHPWFQRARQARPGSAARNFYVWSDTDHKYAGTRIIFLDTEKSNWTWDPVAGAYFWHRFYSHQPDLNFDNPRVLQEVLSVMRFWLDMGVDGLRLDAIPYLVEREGTNNENLPETHTVLKQIRAALDAHAPGRMLLAEANQWPEDTQQYFGDSDECHMAFHFPLMPRMYMAIAREDRFPITDIMRQTPEIPPTCQWAIFLRNHDELTLEMVTDAERDYLWETYAADRRARLNLGIRRRLAPLLERDRRRIELMNAMLLSMPGTPVIYYGDEIGMGDNIHLGDRDGVRTPMQWSSDRNGGFSRADPARLVLPPIMDPLYGYQALNVEAQEADPHSLLNWMRRMLAVRRRFSAFGRGTLRFLYPGNRKVLAYLRELPGENPETILCVCNLSRTAQAVELDLSAFASRLPVDMVGGSVFPPVGQLSYLLTLPPFGFFWFLLAAQAQLPPWHAPVPDALPEFATIVVRRGIEEALAPQGRAILEREALPAYVPKRRWFAAKGERLEAVRLAYAVPLDGADVLFAEIEATHGNRREHYVLPLGIAWEDETTGALAQQLALARIRRGRRVGVLTDGFAVDAFTHAIVGLLRRGARLPLPQGEIRFLPTSRMGAVVVPEHAEFRRLSAEQSNSSLILGDVLVLKILRHVAAGVHPEGEMTRVLTERGFGNTAPLLGEVVRVAADGTPHTLMLAQAFVRNQGDGWGWTLDFLARTVEEIAVTGHETEAEYDAFATYASFAAAMGRRLAEMHAVLAEPTEDPDFAPEEADAAILESWAEGAIEQIDLMLDILRGRGDWPDEATRQLASGVIARADGLREAVHWLTQAGLGGLRTRVHGDFHLGQVLVVSGDAYIIDFEGEPARPMQQRRQKSCPLRDVAGLLRSFEYAAATAAPGRAAASPATEERRAKLLERFRVEAAQRFLESYLAVLDAAPRRWVPAGSETPLIDLFLLEKAAYEVRYEAQNRPGWIGIPLRGLAEIADRVLVPEPEPAE